MIFRSRIFDFGPLFNRLFFIGLLASAGCTKPPAIPQLTQRGPLPIQQIVLSAHLNADDIRGIYHALNADNSLSSLKSVFVDASNESLNEMGDLVGDYVLDEIDYKGGLPQIIRQRIKTKGFSKLLASSRKWSSDPNFPKLADLLFYTLARPEIPELIKSDSMLLDPALAVVMENAHHAMRAEYVESVKVHAPAPESKLLVDDLEKFLNDDKLVKQFSELGALIDRSETGNGVFHALRMLKKNFGAAGFEGFGQGLSRMITQHPTDDKIFASNKLELLLDFANTADDGSEVLFNQFNDAPELLDIVSDAMRDLVVKSYGGWIRNGLEGPKFNREFWRKFVREKPDDLPTENFKIVFDRILRRLEFVGGSAISKDADNESMLRNVSLVLPAYATTKWLEETFSNKQNLIFDPKEKDKSVWDINLGGLSEFKIEFVVLEGTETKFPYAKDLRALNSDALPPLYLDLESLVDKMEAFVTWSKEYDLYAYLAPIDSGISTLRDALPDFTLGLDQSRRIAADRDPFKFVKKLIDPENGLKIFESDRSNLMDLLNQFIGQIPRKWFPTIEEILLRDSGLSRFTSSDVTNRINQLDEKTQRVMERLFLTAPMLAELDVPDLVHHLPSAFELYYLMVKANTQDPHAISATLSFLAQSHFFKTGKSMATDDPRPEFPGIYKLIEGGQSLAKLLFSFGSVPEGKSNSLVLSTLENVNDASDHSSSGIDRNLALVKKVLADKKTQMVAALDLVREKDSDWIFSTEHVTKLERALGLRIINDGAHEKIWRFLKNHVTRAQLLDFAHQLKDLSEKKELQRSFKLLSFINDTRLKKLSQLLLQWEESGELNVSLQLVIEWLQAPDPQPVKS